MQKQEPLTGGSCFLMMYSIVVLLKHDLVDEFKWKIFPITPSGVIFANYERAGDVKTGSV